MKTPGNITEVPLPQIHATAISIDGNGVLLCGASGSGKSDLALRLIDDGARLIADDRCDLTIASDQVFVSCPTTIDGLMEVRGIGILKFDTETRAPVALIVKLCEPDQIERLPDDCTDVQYGVSIPIIRVAPFEASTPFKIRLALGKILGQIESTSQ